MTGQQVNIHICTCITCCHIGVLFKYIFVCCSVHIRSLWGHAVRSAPALENFTLNFHSAHFILFSINIIRMLFSPLSYVCADAMMRWCDDAYGAIGRSDRKEPHPRKMYNIIHQNYAWAHVYFILAMEKWLSEYGVCVYVWYACGGRQQQQQQQIVID